MDALVERLHPGLQRWVREHFRGGLTEVQRLAIPAILDGSDCVVEAPTAGGKTEAVLFPTLTRAAGLPEDSVRVLYLAPLRALLNNLEVRCGDYAAACGLHAFKWHGDVDQKEKVSQLRSAPALLLTTPESVEAILLRKAEWPRFFRGLQAVVIDEAHNFAAGDRGGHLLSLLQRLEQATVQVPQRIALTATIGNPEAMLDWLAGGGRARGVRIRASPMPKERDYRIHLFDSATDTDDTPPERRSGWCRFLLLHKELRERRSIVFARSRAGAEDLSSVFVRAATRGMPEVRVRTHHSAVSRYFREEAEGLIQSASDGALHAIISTSTLELGIDIGELDAVVQMDALSSPAAFLQRVGRTGRRQGRAQVFRGLVTEQEDLLLLTATVSLGVRGTSEALSFPRRAFHLLAHQLLSLALQNHGIAPEAAWERLRHAWCFSGVSVSDFEHLVEHLCAQEYLRLADRALVVGERTEKEFLGTRWRRLFAVFSTAPLFEVFEQKNQVGTLDAAFVEALEVPFHFVLGGRTWEARAVDLERRVVSAVRSRDGNAPRWDSFGGPDVPFETAQEVGRLLTSDIVPIFLDPSAHPALAAARHRVRGIAWTPGTGHLLASDSGRASVWTWAGDRINRTLAKAIEVAGVGKATAGYDEIRVQGPRDRKALAESIAAVIARLVEGDLATPDALRHILKPAQPRYRFSPFAKCLPDDLLAEALVERVLDVEGALRLVRGGIRQLPG
ncbi:MAG: DEAD/DEAH box helicase [Myxococcota bacterium]